MRQAPKWLTYDSPGEPTYLRQVKIDPYIGIQQYGNQQCQHPKILGGPVPYPPGGFKPYSSTSTTHVLEPKFDDDALHAPYSSTTAATMGGRHTSHFSADKQINSFLSITLI